MSREEKLNRGFTAYDRNFDIKIGLGKLLLVYASAVILGFEFLGTQDHILQYHDT
jgi:Ca2+-binding EF-hand superfamily protein